MIFIAHVDGIGVWRTRRAGGGNKLELALINSFHRTWLKMWKTGTWFLFRARFGWNCTPSAFALRRFVALGRVRKSQTPLGWNCTPSAFALGRFVALGRVWKSQPPPPRMWKLPSGECGNYKPHPHGFCTRKICCPWANAKITNPTRMGRMELHLGECGDYKPHPHGTALGRFFSPLRELQAPPAWNCTWKIFPPYANYKPHPHGIALGRFFCPWAES